jgi:hypothetical protein
VTPAGTKGIFGTRSLNLRVRCDIPCTVSISGTLRDRKTRKKGKTPSTPVRFKSRSIPAGKLTVVTARVDVSKLRKAMHGRKGMIAVLRVSAAAADSAPTVVTRRYEVSG